jgi:hypothetical protein
MILQDYIKSETEKMIQSTTCVDAAVIEKFRRELADDYEKYIIENRIRIIKTRQLSDKTIIA